MTLEGDFYNLIFSDQYLLNSSISLLMKKISGDLNDNNFVRLWNIGSYLTDINICFFPTGRKCNQTLINKLWEEENDKSNIQIIKEFRIPYNFTLLKNISKIYGRNFSEKTIRLQHYIYGYCIFCESEHRGKFRFLSHVFTNENTWQLLSKKETQCHNNQLKFISETLNSKKKKICSCVTGAAAQKILGEENSNDFLETEIWSCLTGKNMKTIKTIATQKKLRLPTSKILWFGECYLLPLQNVTLDIDDHQDAYEFISQEKQFCYYNGIKFLHDNLNSDMTLKTSEKPKPKFSRELIPCRVSKKIKISNVWNGKLDNTELIKNATIDNFKSLKNGMWILKNNGVINILSKEYLPLLSLGFAATGKFYMETTDLVIKPANSHSSSGKILSYLKNYLGTCKIKFVNFKKHKKVPKKRTTLKKKKHIIQDEPKGYNIPTLFTLLPRN